MAAVYQETLDGRVFQRLAPGWRHELICSRLHAFVGAQMARIPSARVLPARTKVKLSHATIVCPDLALVTSATGKLWLAAEIVNSDDHRADTVVKKQIYEEMRLPRLWMIDPRYDNVEVYHGSEYGLALKAILAGHEVLTEKLLLEFRVAIGDLFHAEAPSP